MNGTSSWRDLIQVHPAAKEFKELPPDELAALVEDIGREDNIDPRVPPVFWTPLRREELPSPRSKGRYGIEIYLVDGRNRLEAVWRLLDPALPANADADPGDREQYIRGFITAAIDGQRSTSILLYGDVDPWEFVISANIRRRHLDRDQKRDVVARLLKARPERSDRETAKMANVTHPTVAAIRAKLETAGDVENLSTRTDTVGRQQPAHRAVPAAVVHRSSLPPPSSHQSPPPSEEARIRQLRERQAQPVAAEPAPALQLRPAHVVDDCFADLHRRLDEHRLSIHETPLDHLVDLVLNVMGRLGVTIADIKAVETGL
jgi:hypothetical protein